MTRPRTCGAASPLLTRPRPAASSAPACLPPAPCTCPPLPPPSTRQPPPHAPSSQRLQHAWTVQCGCLTDKCGLKAFITSQSDLRPRIFAPASCDCQSLVVLLWFHLPASARSDTGHGNPFHCAKLQCAARKGT
eukprot:296834-Rhodomonas_salina.2